MREQKRSKRFLTWTLAFAMLLSLLPAGALAKKNDTGTGKAGNYFYFMSSTKNDAIVIATKVLHEGDGTVTDFGDVVVPVDATHGVAGWYADRELKTPVTALSYDTARTTPVPLYPEIKEGFWVTFESNGGSYIAPQFFAGRASEPKNAPARFGYAFDGWYTDAALSDKAEFEAITAPVTVYAKWETADAEYTVIHWQENADDDEYSYVESEVLSGRTGERTEAAAKEYAGFTAREITQETIAGDNSTIVNVFYDREEYSVKFWNVLYDGSHHGDLGDEFEELRITAKHGASISDKWPREVKAAWEVEIGSWHIQANIEKMPLGGQNFYRVNPFGEESAEYYTEDLSGSYVLDHTDTGAPTHAAIAEEDCYPLIGFTFKEYVAEKQFWSERDQCLYDDYSGAKFYYTRNSYDVVYMNNSEDPVKMVSYKYQADISKADEFIPDRPEGVYDNYVFAGWYSDKDGKALFEFAGKTMPANNVTVYAKWSPPVCSVKFMAYGKEVSALSGVPYGTSVSTPLLSDWLHEGDTFLGWTYDEAGTAPFKTDTRITEDTVLYAQIDDGRSYTVTYDANGGTGAVKDPYRYARDRTAMVLSGSSLTAPSGRSSFLGWSTAADGSGTVYQPGEPISVSGNITLFAIWKRSYTPPHTPTVEIPDEDPIGLNTDDHFAYIIGYPDGTVRPNGQITRAEATTIFFRLLTDESRENFWSTNNGYPDVSAGQWYNNAISTMTRAGIVDGYPDGTFRPDAPITRAEMAKIISLFAKLDKSESRFSDIAGHWAEHYISLAAGNGWIEGYPDGTFGPQRNITRAETATMINRVLERVPSEESRLLARDAMQIWPDSNPGDWFYLAMQEASNSHDYERNARWAAADEQWTALRENRDWKALEK